jgi:hypothetical protein
MADTPSRLSDGMIYYGGGYIPIQEYRDMIAARNLYNLDNEYENTQLFSPNNQSNVAQSISTVLNVIPQYNRMQINTNLLGNTYDAFRDNGSALARIGLIMLGKQMAYNSAMNLSVKYLPSIDLSQALKGNSNKIFKLNEENTITIKNKEDRTFLDKVGSTASNFLGIDTYDVFGEANPFSKNPTNIDYIRNTGKMQLTRFFKAINLNIYKPINPERRPNYTNIIREYSNEVGAPLLGPIDTLQSVNRVFFNFNDNKQHPYFRRSLSIGANNAAIIANQNMELSYAILGSTVQEYAPYTQYIQDNFGKTSYVEDITKIDDSVKEMSNFSSEKSIDNLVWGRDGVAPEAEKYLNELRGDDVNLQQSLNTGAKTGLLEYTRNLLNATEGNFVDITRKAFKDGNKYVGFQGSPLWRANDSDYAIESGNNTGKGGKGKSGIRQHTILDPYGSDTRILDGTIGFAKAIRFKGNIVYNGNNNGNQNSVIYNTVLPRIHPTRNQNGIGINNKNLMFSIENLAIGTIKRDTFGVIDDEYGTPIPLSEVGPFAGRMMWFPPYNLQINEVAIAKYESTVMIGRNEPLYNYMNSERTAVLSFSLLIDYPEQLRNYISKNDDKNKVIADFFAFGGDPLLPDEAEIEMIEEKIEKLKEQITENGGPTEQADVPDPDGTPLYIFFPNNEPHDINVETIIDEMYKNPNHYEIIDGFNSANNNNGFGLNKFIYFITGITGTSKIDYGLRPNNELPSQYTSINENNQEGFGVSLLNKNLLDNYRNEEWRKYYNIEITGGASKLYLNEGERDYNIALGNRRINATIKLIHNKLSTMFGKSVADKIITNNIQIIPSEGSAGSGELGAKPENMHLEEVKRERYSKIQFKRNTVPVDGKEQKLTSKQQEDIAKIQQDIQSLERQRDAIKSKISENIFNERNKAILNSFESISGNQFYPVFHSQTPEDFHRRLTFLQQCTRQGAAKRYDIKDSNTNELRARNSVFGRQPICILRVADFFYTKVVIESVTIDYADTNWDTNPEGFGMQPMMANITLQMKLIGGQSLKGPIDALQNAVTFNYYANSTFTDKGMYARPSKEATKQNQYMFGVDDGTGSGIVGKKQNALLKAYKEKFGIDK